MKYKMTIAKEVRKGLEVLSKDSPYLPDNLCGLCAIGSIELGKQFKKHGYDAKVVYGRYSGGVHCWVVSNGEIWDVTATQFGLKSKVHKTHADNLRYEITHHNILNRPNKYLSFWPFEQKPNRKFTQTMRAAV